MTEHTACIGRAQKILLLLGIMTVIIGKTGLASDPPPVVSLGPSFAQGLGSEVGVDQDTLSPGSCLCQRL